MPPTNSTKNVRHSKCSLEFSIQIQENVPLAPLTTLKIGGNARYFVRAVCEVDVVEAVRFARANDLDLFVLGGGSNVVIADRGFDGLVMQNSIGGIETRETPPQRGAKTLVSVGAGENWDDFVAYCVNHDLAGIECLSGIPGFVGGTPVQNVGAYGQEVSESIVEVRCFDRNNRDFITLSNAECGFSYRTSIFNSTHRDRFIVLSVLFMLSRGDSPKVVYKDLIEHFGKKRPSLAEVREAVISIRRSKSMVIDPSDENTRSAGSFFKNPIVAVDKLDEIKRSFDRVPFFDVGDMVKIPAAWLIENSGFKKGFVGGRAGISTKHTLALINRGSATADELIVLKDRIQSEVAEKFGIDLHPEPVFVGF